MFGRELEYSLERKREMYFPFTMNDLKHTLFKPKLRSFQWHLQETFSDADISKTSRLGFFAVRPAFEWRPPPPSLPVAVSISGSWVIPLRRVGVYG